MRVLRRLVRKMTYTYVRILVLQSACMRLSVCLHDVGKVIRIDDFFDPTLEGPPMADRLSYVGMIIGIVQYRYMYFVPRLVWRARIVSRKQKLNVWASLLLSSYLTPSERSGILTISSNSQIFLDFRSPPRALLKFLARDHPHVLRVLPNRAPKYLAAAAENHSLLLPRNLRIPTIEH
jgi:hypothetical protein